MPEQRDLGSFPDESFCVYCLIKFMTEIVGRRITRFAKSQNNGIYLPISRAVVRSKELGFMFSRFLVLSATLAACAFLSCGNVAAVTITSQSTSYLPPAPVADNVSPSFFLPNTLYGNVVDSVPNVYRSPYQNIDTTMPAAYVGQPYSTVVVGGVGYNFALGANTLGLLWGSPDAYNTLSFYSGLNGQGTLLGSFTGLDLAATLGLGHDYVTFFSSIAFLSVVLSTTIPAFEYAALSASIDSSQVPLPPAMILFGSGILALELLRRRRRKGTKTTAAV